MQKARTEKLSTHLSPEDYLLHREKSNFIKDKVVAAVRRHISSEEINILDVGSSSGTLSNELSKIDNNKKIFCSDIDIELLKTLKNIPLNKKNNLKFIIHSNKNLPFKDNSFDCVISLFSLHHFKYPSTMIEEMIRVVKTDKKVIIIDLAPSSYKLRFIYFLQKCLEFFRMKPIRRAFLESVKAAYKNKEIFKILNEANASHFSVKNYDIFNTITINKPLKGPSFG